MKIIIPAETSITNDSNDPIRNVEIYGDSGSPAEIYANSRGLDFTASTCSGLVYDDFTRTIVDYKGSARNIFVPSSYFWSNLEIDYIGDNCFRGTDSLEEVSMSNDI